MEDVINYNAWFYTTRRFRDIVCIELKSKHCQSCFSFKPSVVYFAIQLVYTRSRMLYSMNLCRDCLDIINDDFLDLYYTIDFSVDLTIYDIHSPLEFYHVIQDSLDEHQVLITFQCPRNEYDYIHNDNENDVITI